MPRKRSPRKGSMQFWHRQRAKRMTARVRCWAPAKEVKPMGFAGYKAGMTHVIGTDNRTSSPTKKEEIVFPVTIVECPPMKVIGVILFKTNEKGYGVRVAGQINASSFDKDIARVLRIPKKKSKEQEFKPEELTDVRLLCATSPRLIGLKKKPEIIELAIGGATIAEKLAYAKGIVGKELKASDVFSEGQQLDCHAVTKGKGFQGPVKRHGVNLRHHKSEKTIRGPGSLGPWEGNRSWTVAHAGQTGFHQRMEHNKWLLKIGANPAEINPKGGFIRYGLVKGNYLLLKGSIAGPKKRLVTLTHAIRPDKTLPKTAPVINFVSLASKQ